MSGVRRFVRSFIVGCWPLFLFGVGAWMLFADNLLLRIGGALVLLVVVLI